MRRVFLTGATGVMGMAGLQELTSESGRYQVTVLARPGRINEKKLAPYVAKGVEVIWGDLLDPDAIERGVAGADIVLHVGGMVSPAADWHPQRTMQVNVGSMRLIAEAVRKRENADPSLRIGVVYIGSVSQYGDRRPPHHWGKVGTRLGVAKFDAYALSKIEAERVLVEAGLRRWMSLRQTAILHPGLLSKADDPISFHVPLRGAIEWVSVEDSGRLLERVCRENIPEELWCSFHNVGGGENWRMTNYEFESRLMRAIGCPPPEKVFEPGWFATRNFHGIWFCDSDALDAHLHYRDGERAEECFERMSRGLPWYYRLAPLAPSFMIKMFMKRVALTPKLGPLWWFEHGDEDRIEAAFGSREAHDKIGGWSEQKLTKPDFHLPASATGDIVAELISGGFDCHHDVDAAWAHQCVNPLEDETSPDHAIRWQCRAGHTFMATPRLIWVGGHGCPECLRKYSRVSI